MANAKSHTYLQFASAYAKANKCKNICLLSTLESLGLERPVPNNGWPRSFLLRPKSRQEMTELNRHRITPPHHFSKQKKTKTKNEPKSRLVFRQSHKMAK